MLARVRQECLRGVSSAAISSRRYLRFCHRQVATVRVNQCLHRDCRRHVFRDFFLHGCVNFDCAAVTARSVAVSCRMFDRGCHRPGLVAAASFVPSARRSLVVARGNGFRQHCLRVRRTTPPPPIFF
ncbi:hypothetical protein MRX96_036786 [Rhipicephalus microplus]